MVAQPVITFPEDIIHIPRSEYQAIQNYVWDQREYTALLEEENTSLREEKAELKERFDAKSAEAATWLRESDAYRAREQKRKEIWRNKDLIPMEKAVLQDALEVVMSKKVDYIGSPTVVVAEQIAERIGASPATVSAKLGRLAQMSVLDYQVGQPEAQRDGSFYTPIHIAFTELADRPALIRKEGGHQGGSHPKKRCAGCQTEELDSYTVTYCRECRTVQFYGQIGLKKDASVVDVIKAIREHQVVIDPSARKPEQTPDNAPVKPVSLETEGTFPIDQVGLYEITPNGPENAPAPNTLSDLSTSNSQNDKLSEAVASAESGPVQTVPSNVLVEPCNPPMPVVVPFVASETLATTDTAAREIIKRWLASQCLGGTIKATGSLKSADKYKTNYNFPDLAAYIRGDKDHIYGSRRVADLAGTTSKICFEIDDPEHDAQVERYLHDLIAAGACPIYWRRYISGRRRGHLEIYFDGPVNPDQARAWCVAACPGLLAIQECYPCGDRRNNPLSFSLWQRSGDQVAACTAYSYLEEASILEPMRLAEMIQMAITPAALIEAFPMPPAPAAPVTPSVAPARKGSHSTQGGLDGKSIASIVIADFNALHSWRSIATLCGGMTPTGKFKAIWRGESSASVCPDAHGKGDFAIDYGSKDGWPRKFDRYQAWCLATGADKKADLAERCKEYEARQKGKS